MRTLIRTLCLCLVAAAALCIVRPASADGFDLTGRWDGYGKPPGPTWSPPSAMLSRPPGPAYIVSFDVFFKERRMHADFALPGVDNIVPGIADVNGDGITDFSAPGSRTHFKSHGKVYPIGGTLVYFGDFSYTDMNGCSNHGLVGMLRNIGGTDWVTLPAPTDFFRGVWLGDGMGSINPAMQTDHKFSLSLGNMAGSQMNGSSSFFDVFLVDAERSADSFFDVFFTVNVDGHNVLLGHESQQDIWMMCDGSVRNADNVMFADGSVRGTFFLINLVPVPLPDAPIPDVIDFGPFKLLPAVQRGM